MNFLIQNILAAFLPVAIDGVKQLVGRVSGGIRPSNIDEQIKLDNSIVERLKALAALDNPYGTPSQWVIDLRASFRYIAAGFCIAAGVAVQFIGDSNFQPAELLALKATGLDMAGMAFSFIFGDRVYLNLKGRT